MTRDHNTTGLKRRKWAAGVYTAIVVTIFVLLMQALLHEERRNTAVQGTQTDNAEIAVIIEQLETDTGASPDAPEPQNLTNPSNAARQPDQPQEKLAWTSYASAWAETAKPAVAIIIDDLGLDEIATEKLAAMVSPLTLAYLPYADNLKQQTETIRRAGHELMMHLPMQSHNNSADPGDNALLTDLPFDDFARRLEWNLARFDGYVGINNHMGSRLTEDPGLMVRVMARLKRSGLLFVDSLTTPDSVGARAAGAVNVPYVKRDVFLDNERSLPYIKAQIDTLERIAHLRGYAVGIGHPYPETLEALNDWQKTLAFKEITLVPISQIVSMATERRSSGKQ